MIGPLRIVLIGDYNPEHLAHLAIPTALARAASTLGVTVDGRWLNTDAIPQHTRELSAAHGIWVTPGSPYRSMEAVLGTIRRAREQRLPYLGTCGGFQHALIEFARNALGMTGVEHEESNPAADALLISRLACPLRGTKGMIRLTPDSQLAAACGTTETEEEYNCSFGLNPAFESRLETSGLRFSARDGANGIRGFELPGHPFFIGTLFQPERSALAGRTHPLITSFLRAAATVQA